MYQRYIVLRSLFLILTVVLVSGTQGYTQSNILNDLSRSFGQYNTSVLKEKVFLHTDRDSYIAGNTLWFKLYNTGTNNQLLTVSKVAYVEILNDSLKPVLQAKVEIKEGSGNGSFYLPVSLASGNYIIRAYTNWIKNFGSKSFFEKNITIINPLKGNPIAASEGPSVYNVQFFPEGGNLVNGISGRIAFKVSGPDGFGVNFRGAIIDQHNDTISRFKPLKFGIGSFEFTPKSGSSYKVVVIPANEKPVYTSLPEIFPEGFAINISTLNDGNVKIAVNTNIHSSDLYIVGHTSGQILVTEHILLQEGKGELIIKKEKLADGINSFTLFNDLKKPVCERLYFKYPENDVKLSATFNSATYARREKVRLEIAASGNGNKPLKSDLSLSIYRLNNTSQLRHSDIQSYIYLTSELKGTIEQPGSYFEEKGSQRQELVDNLMLTHGWRKFDWHNILLQQQSSFKYLPEYEGHIVRALVKNKLTNKPAENILAYLSIPGKSIQLYVSKTDSNGIASFNTKNFYGSNEVVVQTDPLSKDTYAIEVLSPFSNEHTPQTASLNNLKTIPDSIAKQLLSESLNMQVNNIFNGDKLRQISPPKVDSAAFFGKPNKRYLLDDYTRFTTVEEVLREYIPEIWLVKNEGKLNLSVIDQQTNNSFTSEPLMILDGVPVFHSEKLIRYDPLKIRSLDIINRRYYLGPAVFDGIVNFSTYNGDLEGFQLDDKAAVVDYEGLLAQRQFYSPQYMNEEQKNSPIPDFRDLLYWSPSIRTDESGKTSVEFYTSDQKGEYIGVLQGVSEEGNLINKTVKIAIK
ncbi:hypothetical protein [Arcticibacter tournemirensis]|uniref:Macroglobulin domain-containing protein n=2 Tax=Pseudomonadati TaxID=3379134 RepID=A0A4Q0MG70_9SPHI|nr:hypothetical protein [Arcticibacter tournemirensis]RXF71926.1 hypothetical protein EKH83_04375 [Arcticibacter tournemirensis]